jgi:putative phosphoribosyl transferase
MAGMLMKNDIRIRVGNVNLEAEVVVPDDAGGLIIFAHGSGSSRHSPRNQKVATALNENNFATLLIDLLTPEEDRTYDNRFDIKLLAERLAAVTTWCALNISDYGGTIGYFGASTGAAAAILAATLSATPVDAIVSRGGRPDLAWAALEKNRSPVSLIVGSLDTSVLQLNHEAFRHLRNEKELVIINGATHLFEEPFALEQVAHAAGKWFMRHLHPKPATAG